MKKYSLALTAIVASTLLSAGDVELQVVGGKNFIDCDKNASYQDSDTVGVRANFFLSKNNALQLAYDKLDDVKDDKDAHRYSVNYMAIQKDNGSKVHPFMLLGGGYEDGVDRGQGFMNLGVGAEVELSKKVNLVAEIKGIRTNVDKDVDINTNIGLGYTFTDEPCNTVIKEDCLAKEIAPKLIQRKIVVEEEPIIIDEKVKCVR